MLSDIWSRGAVIVRGGKVKETFMIEVCGSLIRYSPSALTNIFSFFQTEGVTGCPPPDFKVSRGKFKSMTTEQPFVTFETTQLYLPQDFTTNDLEFVDGKAKDNAAASFGEQVGRNAQKDSKVKENPFWFEDIIKDAEQHYNHPDYVQHHHSHHHNQREKRNHHKKTMRHVDNEKVLSKRSVEYQEEDYPQDEVFSASEVVGNIFNENDTLAAFEGGRNNGKLPTVAFTKISLHKLLFQISICTTWKTFSLNWKSSRARIVFRKAT